MDDLAKKLAKNLRALRGEATLREFGRKLGIDASSLNRLEQAKQNITLSTLQKICFRLKCDLGDLFKPGEDRRKPKD